MLTECSQVKQLFEVAILLSEWGWAQVHHLQARRKLKTGCSFLNITLLFVCMFFFCFLLLDCEQETCRQWLNPSALGCRDAYKL